MLGEDTDTTACIAGGIAGLLYEYGRHSDALAEVLKGPGLVKKLLDEIN